MTNIVPQLFYDLIARILPGGTLLIFAFLSIFGSNSVFEFWMKQPTKDNILTLPTFLLYLLVSYLIGFYLSQLWRFTYGKLTRKKELKIEKQCIDTHLKEHNQLQKTFSKPELTLDLKDVPPVSTMREHIRLVDPDEADRLLKLRAERRQCQVLVVGLSILVILNMLIPIYIMETNWPARICLEILMILIILINIKRSESLLKHFVNRTSVGWLVRVSTGKIF